MQAPRQLAKPETVQLLNRRKTTSKHQPRCLAAVSSTPVVHGAFVPCYASSITIWPAHPITAQLGVPDGTWWALSSKVQLPCPVSTLQCSSQALTALLLALHQLDTWTELLPYTALNVPSTHGSIAAAPVPVPAAPLALSFAVATHHQTMHLHPPGTPLL